MIINQKLTEISSVVNQITNKVVIGNICIIWTYLAFWSLDFFLIWWPKISIYTKNPDNSFHKHQEFDHFLWKEVKLQLPA